MHSKEKLIFNLTLHQLWCIMMKGKSHDPSRILGSNCCEYDRYRHLVLSGQQKLVA